MRVAAEVVNTENLSRLELVPMLVDAAIRCAEAHGSDQTLEGLAGPVRCADVDRISIIWRTPKARAHGDSNFGVDAWYDGKKVLSVYWNSDTIKDYEVVKLKRGPWVPELLSMPA
jgi:hypothetical protein